MMGVMHFYFHFTQPLFVQSLMGIKNIYDANPIAIHILENPLSVTSNAHSKPLVCSVQVRSVHVIAFFFSLLLPSFVALAAGPKTDAAAIAEAEKKIGKKEE